MRMSCGYGRRRNGRRDIRVTVVEVDTEAATTSRYFPTSTLKWKYG